MKNSIKIIFVMFLMFNFVNCTKSDNELTGNENVGGLIGVAKTNVSYVVGNGQSTLYNTDLTALQGKEKIVKIEIYNEFTNVLGIKSNKILFRTLTFPTINSFEVTNLSFSFDQLRSGLLIGGNPLPALDTGMSIGDFWTLSYVTTTLSGKRQVNYESTKVAIATRYAGTYRCVQGAYYRIKVLTYTTPDWPSMTIIESVNTTTYRVKKYFGPFINSSVATGGDFYFTVDNLGKINYPANTPPFVGFPLGIPQQGNTQPFVTCLTAPTELTLVNCGTSNFVTPDNSGAGKDRLTMSFGYLNGPGLPREFFQVMEKIN